MFDIFIPFGSFAVVMIGIVAFIIAAVTVYNIVSYLINRDWDDERFD